GVADVLDRLPDDGREIGVGLGRDLSRDERETRGDDRLARDAAVGVLAEERVQDRVGDLVGDLVGMALGDRLRGEEMTAVLAHAFFVLRARRAGAPSTGPISRARSKPRTLSPGTPSFNPLFGAASGTRVELIVELAEPLARDVRVDLRRRDVGVAEHGL